MGFVIFTALVIFLVIGALSYAFYVKEKKKTEEIETSEFVIQTPIFIESPTEAAPLTETKELVESVGLLTQEDVNKLKKTKPVRKKAAPKKTSRKRK